MSSVEDPAECTIQHEGIAVRFVLPSESDHISKVLRSSGGFYELEMLSSLAPALEPGDVVVDAGANIGNHTVFFAKICGCRVLAFEAMPGTADVLERNVEINGLSSLVKVHRVALGHSESRAKVVRYDPANVGGTTLALDDAGSIDVWPLDALVTQAPVRLLKIDVEGMDLDVLRGAVQILSRDRPWVVCEAGTPGAYAAIHDFMREAGYLPVGVYNATDTYLFLPSRTDAEREVLAERGLQQLMGLQREKRDLAGRIAQAGRYTERVRASALAEVDKRLKSWVAPEEAGEPVDASIFQRAMALKDEQIADLQAAMVRERRFVERSLASAKARTATSRSDAAAAERRVAEAQERLAWEQVRIRELQETHKRSLAQLDEEVARNRQLQREAAQLSSRLAGALQVNQLAKRRESILKGLIARHERQLERQDLDKEASTCRLRRIEQSLAYRVGVLTVGSLKSPVRLVALAWRVPLLILREWRVRRASRK